MALTEAQKLKIAKILNTDYVTVNDKIFDLGTTYITPEVETQVIAELARWDAGVGTDFVSVEPNTANYGARIDPELEKGDIRRNLINLLYLQDLLGRTSTSQKSLVRG